MHARRRNGGLRTRFLSPSSSPPLARRPAPVALSATSSCRSGRRTSSPAASTSRRHPRANRRRAGVRARRRAKKRSLPRRRRGRSRRMLKAPRCNMRLAGRRLSRRSPGSPEVRADRERSPAARRRCGGPARAAALIAVGRRGDGEVVIGESSSATRSSRATAAAMRGRPLGRARPPRSDGVSHGRGERGAGGRPLAARARPTRRLQEDAPGGDLMLDGRKAPRSEEL